MGKPRRLQRIFCQDSSARWMSTRRRGYLCAPPTPPPLARLSCFCIENCLPQKGEARDFKTGTRGWGQRRKMPELFADWSAPCRMKVSLRGLLEIAPARKDTQRCGFPLFPAISVAELGKLSPSACLVWICWWGSFFKSVVMGDDAGEMFIYFT